MVGEGVFPILVVFEQQVTVVLKFHDDFIPFAFVLRKPVDVLLL